MRKTYLRLLVLIAITICTTISEINAMKNWEKCPRQIDVAYHVWEYIGAYPHDTRQESVYKYGKMSVRKCYVHKNLDVSQANTMNPQNTDHTYNPGDIMHDIDGQTVFLKIDSSPKDIMLNGHAPNYGLVYDKYWDHIRLFYERYTHDDNASDGNTFNVCRIKNYD